MTDTGYDPAAAITDKLKDMTADEAVKMARELCARLGGDAESFHGNIWPDNVRLDWDGKAVLGESSDVPANRREAEQVEYLAPEFFWENEGTAAADVYSVGLLLYAACSGGYLPFQPKGGLLTPKDRSGALRKRMKGEPITPPTGITPELAEVIKKALAYEPEDRYISAAEMLAALGETDEALPAAAPEPVTAPAPEPVPEAEETTEPETVSKPEEAPLSEDVPETEELPVPKTASETDEDLIPEFIPGAEDTTAPAGTSEPEDAPVPEASPEIEQAPAPKAVSETEAAAGLAATAAAAAAVAAAPKKKLSRKAKKAAARKQQQAEQKAKEGKGAEKEALTTAEPASEEAPAEITPAPESVPEEVPEEVIPAPEPVSEEIPEEIAPEPEPVPEPEPEPEPRVPRYTVQKDFETQRKKKTSVPTANRKKRTSPLIPILCILALAVIAGAAYLLRNGWPFADTDASAEVPEPYTIEPSQSTMPPIPSQTLPVFEEDEPEATPAEDESETPAPEKEENEPEETVPIGSAMIDGMTVEPVSDTVRISDTGANLRTGPGTNYAVADSLPRGAELTRTGTVNGWSQVQYDGGEYYVASNLVTALDAGGEEEQETAPETTPKGQTAKPTGESDTIGTLVVSSDVNLRSGPGTEYEKLAEIKAGTVLPVTGRSDDGKWYLVSVDGREGYVNRKLISVRDYAQVTGLTGTLTVTGEVNLRLGPGTGYDILSVAKPGDKLTLTGSTDTGWYRVQVNGRTAYLAGNYGTVD